MTKFAGNLIAISICMILLAFSADSEAAGRLKPTGKKSPMELAERQYQKGIKAADKAISYENAGNLAKAEKQHKRAVNYYAKAIKIAPRIASVRTDLGYSLIKIGSYSQALEVLIQQLKKMM